VGALARVGLSESQSQAVYGAAPREPFTPWRSLRLALDDFREAWQEGIPTKLHESSGHVESQEVLGVPPLGGPAMTDRFKGLLAASVHDDPTKPPRTPMRRAVQRMMDSGNLTDRVGGRYLFALACRGFDVFAAGLSLTPPLMPEYAPWYAERAIRRADEVSEQVERQRERPRRIWVACAATGCDTLTEHELCEVHRLVQ